MDGSSQWRCSVRGKEPCSATVKQVGGTFTMGPKLHNHPAKPGILTAEIKSVANLELYDSAESIVKKVFQTVKQNLPSAPKVSSFVVDFEKGLWKGLRSVFQNPIIHGCSFHFAQALYKQVQKKGLQHEYEQKGNVYELLRKVFALPFLPADDIASAFQKLSDKVDASACRLTAFFQYVHDTWITNRTWPLQSITVFGRSIRTNNDVEGWHNRINRRAKKSNLPFYMLVILLYTEYRYVAYRQFVRWCWGFLGKNIRVVIPSCAVTAIRNAFQSDTYKTTINPNVNDHYDSDKDSVSFCDSYIVEAVLDYFEMEDMYAVCELGTLKCEAIRLLRTTINPNVNDHYDSDKDSVSFRDSYIVEAVLDYFEMEDMYAVCLFLAPFLQAFTYLLDNPE
ncbi:hypothetical protein GQR58_025784 [Nymphon striatum]|nr:hypothetical protein GQR58_025784 [Nymphon striatum]